MQLVHYFQCSIQYEACSAVFPGPSQQLKAVYGSQRDGAIAEEDVRRPKRAAQRRQEEAEKRREARAQDERDRAAAAASAHAHEQRREAEHARRMRDEEAEQRRWDEVDGRDRRHM
jgi:hypothetical protein